VQDLEHLEGIRHVLGQLDLVLDVLRGHGERVVHLVQHAAARRDVDRHHHRPDVVRPVDEVTDLGRLAEVFDRPGAPLPRPEVLREGRLSVGRDVQARAVEAHVVLRPAAGEGDDARRQADAPLDQLGAEARHPRRVVDRVSGLLEDLQGTRALVADAGALQDLERPGVHPADLLVAQDPDLGDHGRLPAAAMLP